MKINDSVRFKIISNDSNGPVEVYGNKSKEKCYKSPSNIPTGRAVHSLEQLAKGLKNNNIENNTNFKINEIATHIFTSYQNKYNKKTSSFSRFLEWCINLVYTTEAYRVKNLYHEIMSREGQPNRCFSSASRNPAPVGVKTNNNYSMAKYTITLPEEDASEPSIIVTPPSLPPPPPGFSASSETRRQNMTSTSDFVTELKKRFASDDFQSRVIPSNLK